MNRCRWLDVGIEADEPIPSDTSNPFDDDLLRRGRCWPDGMHAAGHAAAALSRCRVVGAHAEEIAGADRGALDAMVRLSDRIQAGCSRAVLSQTELMNSECVDRLPMMGS